MKRLFIITLEPLEQRYTKQWHSYLPKEFSKYFNVITIDGNTNEQNISSGKFLDINLTNVWKAQQIEKVAYLFHNKNIKDDDIFLFMDGWHYGITAIKYMSQLNNIRTKIYTYLHAGTWDENDFIVQKGMRQWAHFNEAGWLSACDGHFVATKYHKNLICKYFNGEFKDIIHVVSFPMDWKKEIGNIKSIKEDIVIFPHRLDKEKCPEIFDSIIPKFKEVKFLKTQNMKLSKKEYYNLLSKSKVIFSANKQETFGIGTVEALLLDNIPVVSNKLSYKELYPKQFRYDTIEEAEKMILRFIIFYKNIHLQKLLKETKQKLIKQSLNSVKQMSKVMLK